MAVPPTPDKHALRGEMRALRRAYVASVARDDRLEDATFAAAAHVAAAIPSGALVALYRPVGSEISPAPLVPMLTRAGHDLALPWISADRERMCFRRWCNHAPVTRGPFGSEQPSEAAAIVAPTLIVTPLLGFDRKGGRLGQGAGCYDRLFAGLPHAIRIGYGWSVQEIETVPQDPWDMPLHAVATERALIACEGAAW